VDLSGPMQSMQAPQNAHPAAAALLLALLDQDCKLWLSSGFDATDAATWLRFHTGCTLVADSKEADFVWVASPLEMPAFEQLAQGTAEYPEQSATCVVQVMGLATSDQAGAWSISGPGINGTSHCKSTAWIRNFLSNAEQAKPTPRAGLTLYLPTACRWWVCRAPL